MNDAAEGAPMAKGEITLTQVYAELCEMRGSTDARLAGMEGSSQQVLVELQAMRRNGQRHVTKLDALHEAHLPDRVASLELRWKVALAIGGTLLLMVAGLFADLLRGLAFGG